MSQTAIWFHPVLGRENLDGEVTALLDGKPVVNGQLISLGHHEFRIIHSKADVFGGRIFTWYGGNEFGTIHLHRSKGGLDIAVKPAATSVQITGTEFQGTFSNTTGKLITLPTDEYIVRVVFPHWREERNVHVFADSTNSITIDPKFGSAELTCNQSNASFQVTKNAEILERGEFPAQLTELPAGKYEIIAFHHNYQIRQALEIRSSETNSLACDFLYGSAKIESRPAGARVFSQDGRLWGTTPLTISELPVGDWKFEAKLDGFEVAFIVLKVSTNETVAFSTNLVSFSYTGGLRNARAQIQSGNYRDAVATLQAVLREVPEDAATLSLLKEAEGLSHIAQGEAVAKTGGFTAAISQLNEALALLPGNTRALSLLEDFKVREAGQLRILKAARLTQGKGLLESLAPQYKGWSSFDVNELSSTKKKADLHAAIRTAFGKSSGFGITKDQEMGSDCFCIEAVQKITGAIGFVTGKRVCVVVGSQATDEECLVFYKILEYKAASFMTLGPADLVGVIDDHMVPAVATQDGKPNDKLLARIKEGVTAVREILLVAAR